MAANVSARVRSKMNKSASASSHTNGSIFMNSALPGSEKRTNRHNDNEKERSSE
jgi:hypothetical protein